MSEELTPRERSLANLRPFEAGNPGRPKGSRNKLSEDFVAKLYEDFTAHGSGAITKCREESPEVYVKVIAGLLPKEMHIKESALEEMSADDIRDALARIAAIRTALLGPDAVSTGSGVKTPEVRKSH